MAIQQESLLRGLDSAIRLSTRCANLRLVTGGRIYYQVAPQSVTQPYVVYSIPSGITGGTFGLIEEDMRLNFNIYDFNKSSVNVMTIACNIEEVFEGWNSMTISNSIFNEQIHLFCFDKVIDRVVYDGDDQWTGYMQFIVRMEKDR